ncbi:hypothetical protein FRC10_003479 [Ceratobasidium sp. 414]|nr:hypothetical protein FRC10_003479 [Ceratobasidium sp. 414]
MEALSMHRAYLDHMENPNADDPDFDDNEEEEQEGGKEDNDDGDDDFEFQGLQWLALDDKDDNQDECNQDEREERKEEAGDEARGGNEGAVVEGDIEEEHEQEEVVLEQRDVENGTWEEAQFDTALYLADLDRTGIFRYRACRVCAIFELPKNLHQIYSQKLVYVELFNPFTGPDRSTNLYRTSHLFVAARRDVLVMPLSQLHMACHIALWYGTATADLDLETEPDILSACKKFVFNDFGSFFSFELMHHWLNVGAME